jgi:hypothetical protein
VGRPNERSENLQDGRRISHRAGGPRSHCAGVLTDLDRSLLPDHIAGKWLRSIFCKGGVGFFIPNGISGLRKRDESIEVYRRAEGTRFLQH